MSTFKKFIRKPFGFTLVELIVVITILVILGTIAFTSLAGYSGSARDSSRISDLTNISKGLDIAYAKTSSYPMPDSSFTVTYSGGAVWYQGEVGTTVMNILTSAGAKLSKQPPLDPLVTTAKYTYSKVAYAKDSYQLKANWEGDKIAYTSPSPFGRGLGLGLTEWSQGGEFISQAQAASGNPTVAYIAGNYNGVVAKTQTGTMTYILAVPSIVSNTGSVGLVLAIDSAQKSLSGTLLTNGGSNTTGVTYNPQVAYASGSLPSTTAEKTALATGIATAYSGTSLVSSSNIQPYIAAYAANDTTTLASLGGNAGSSVGGSTNTTSVVVVSATWTIAGGGDCTGVDNSLGANGDTSTCTDSRVYTHSGGTGLSFTGKTYTLLKIPSDTIPSGIWWFNQNLAYPIPDSSKYRGSNTWSGGDLGYYSCPGNSATIADCSLVPTYGYLYQWSAAMSGTLSNNSPITRNQGICPSGWGIPTKVDFTSAGDIYWPDDLNSYVYTGSTTGFVPVYAGARNNNSNGSFANYVNPPPGTANFLWTSFESSATSSWYEISHIVSPGQSKRLTVNKGFGLSVRCLKN